MDYREKFEMNDYSYNQFQEELNSILETGAPVNLTVLDNCAELLLQADLMTVQPINEELPETAVEFKSKLIDNYNYLASNMENDFKVYVPEFKMMNFLVMYLTKEFNKHEESK